MATGGSNCFSPFGAKVHAPWGSRCAPSCAAAASRRTRCGRTTGPSTCETRTRCRPTSWSRRPRSIEISSSASSAARRCWGALPRERCARTADPAPAPRSAHAALAAAPARPVARRGRALRLVPDPARDLPRAARRPLRPRCAPRVTGGPAERQPPARRGESGRPFAASLNFEYVAQYLYEDDAPAARGAPRGGADARPRPVREPPGSDESCATCSTPTRSDAGRARARRRAAPGRDAQHDLCRLLRLLGEAELPARLPDGPGRSRGRTVGRPPRRAGRGIGGEDRLIAAEDIGRYRDGAGSDRPAASRASRARAGRAAIVVARSPAGAAPPARLLAERYPRARRRRARAGRTRARGGARTWPLDRRGRPRVVRRRGAAPHPPRVGPPAWREVEAVEQPALARFALAGTAPAARAPAGSIACARSRCSASRSRRKCGTARCCRCVWVTTRSCSTS